MAATVTELEKMIVRLLGDGTSYQKMLKDAESATKSTGKSIESTILQTQAFKNSLRGFAGSILAGVTASAGGIGMLNNVFKGVHLAADMEQMEVSFKVMTGSASLAKKVLADLAEFAAKTPFEMPEVVASAKILKTFGFELDVMKPLLTDVGNLASASGARFEDVARALGRIKAGDFGEAFERLRDFGISRAMLEGKGLKFDAQGSYKGSVQAAVEAVRKVIQEKFGGMMEEQAVSFHGLASTMRDDLNAFLRDIGKEVIVLFQLKELMQEVSKWAQKAGEWFKSLSPEMKRAAFIISAVALAVGTLLILWPALVAVIAPVIAAVKVLIALFFGPWGIVIAAVVGFVALAVKARGGWTKTFEDIKTWALSTWTRVRKAAEDAWEWTAPIRFAIASLFDTIWKTAVEVWNIVYDWAVKTWNRVYNFIMDIWNDISNGIGMTWEDIQTYATTGILAIEFALLNMDKIMDMVWAGALYYAIKWFEQIKYFFLVAIPATLAFFRDNWYDIFKDVFNYAYTVFDNLGHNIARLLAAIPDIIKNGGLSDEMWSDIWRPIGEGFIRETKKLVLPDRVVGDMEKQLKKMFDEQKGSLGKSWEQFLDEKMREFGLPPAAVAEMKKNGEEAGKKTGEALNSGIAKELKKMDAVVTGSAESLARIAEYRERLALRGPLATGGGAGANVAGVGAPPAVAGGVPGVANALPPTVVAGQANRPASSGFGELGSRMLAAMVSIDLTLKEEKKKRDAKNTTVMNANLN